MAVRHTLPTLRRGGALFPAQPRMSHAVAAAYP